MIDLLQVYPLSHSDVKDVDLSYALRHPDGKSTFRHGREASMESVLVRFGNQLRKVRTATGVSQEKLAELAGLHRTYVSTVERGLRNISLVNIEKLAQALSVPMAKLMP